MKTLTVPIIILISSVNALSQDDFYGRDASIEKACNPKLLEKRLQNIQQTSEDRAMYGKNENSLEETLKSKLHFDSEVTERLVISFIINCKGELYNYKIQEGSETNARKLIQTIESLGNWKPATERGDEIDIPMILRIEIKNGEIK